jgi:CubicO group peptidase (beta-lactamase class C family)
MRKKLRRFSALTFLALLPFATIASSNAETAVSNDALKLEQIFHPASRTNVPGCSVAIDRDAHPRLMLDYGVTNLEQPQPITSTSVFEAGSVSKQFTAAAIAVLAAEGRLSLDDDIRRFVPEFPDYGTPITIRELLNHTSGLRNWDDLVQLQGSPRGTRLYTQDAIMAILRRQLHPNFRPGSEYLYSNSNYVVAAVIAARASGETFEQFSQRALFVPLGMTQTQWRDDYTTVVHGRTYAFTPDAAGVWHLDMPFENLVGPGGLLTTTGDLLKWNDALTHPAPANARWVALLNEPGRISNGTLTGYALGLEIESIAGISVLSHAGATAGYRAYLARVPSQGLSLAILCNDGGLNTEELGPHLTALFLPPKSSELVEASLKEAGRSSPAASLAGLYRNEETGAPVTVAVSGGAVRFNGGEAFFAVSQTVLTNVGATRRASITRSSGAIASIRLTRTGNVDVLLAPVKPWKPTVSELNAFPSHYTNKELDAAFTVGIEHGELAITGQSGIRWALKPVYEGVFESSGSGWLVRFLRDRRGNVEALSCSDTRTRNVRFDRDALRQ